MLVCVFFCASCTRDRGCGAHPVFPAPSVSRGTTKCKTSGASRREIMKSWSIVVARLDQVKPGDDNQFVACGLPPTPAFQFCNRSHVDIDIPALAPAI